MVSSLRVLALLSLAVSLHAQSYRKLSGPITTEASSLRSWELTPDGARVVFDRFGTLLSAPLDGGAPVTLSSFLPGTCEEFALTPDGNDVVVIDRAGSQYRLYRLPVLGGTPVALGPSGPEIESFRISPSGARVVYRVRTTSNQFDLWSTPADGSAAPVKLNAVLVPGGSVQSDYRISPGGLRVLYRADQDIDNVTDLYAVATDGSLAPVRLNVSESYADVTDFQIAFDNFTTVYRADQDTDGKLELYITSTLGGVTPVKRSGPIVAGGSVTSFQLAAADHRMVFLADAEVDGRVELYSIDPTVPGARVKISGTLANDRDVQDARISADGQAVAYRSNQDVAEQVELYGVPADGAVAPTKLNGPLGTGESIHSDYEIESSSARVVFHRDMAASPTVSSLQLYSAPIDGSEDAVRLNRELVELGTAVLEHAGSEGVLFAASTEVATRLELYHASLAGDTVPLRLSQPLPGGHSVRDARVTPDGSRVVFQVRRGPEGESLGDELFAVPLAGGASTRVEGSLVEGSFPVGGVGDYGFSRDGTHVVYKAMEAPSAEYELFSARRDGSGSRVRLGRASWSVWEPTRSFETSPDGKRVVHLLNTIGPLTELCSARIGVPDSEVVLERDAVAFDGLLERVRDFVLAPDGQAVVYWVASGADTLVKRRRIDGSTPAEVLLTWPGEADLHLSPDGSWIALAGPSGLHGYPLDGHQAPQRLDLGAVEFTRIVFTPDSERVLFTTTGGVGDGLFSARVDGSQAAVQVAPGAEIPFELTSGGTEVLFLADLDPTSGRELHRAPVGGGSPTGLGGAGVLYFQEDRAAGRVVFYDDSTDSLYSVLHQGGAPILLTTGNLSRLAGQPFRLAGGRVLYSQWTIVCDAHETVDRLYSVPIVGGQAPSRLDFGPCSEGVLPGVRVRGSKVFFVFRKSLSDDFELYRAPLDANLPAERVEGPAWIPIFSAFVSAFDIQLAPDGEQLLCLTNQDTGSFFALELFALELKPHARTRTAR